MTALAVMCTILRHLNAGLDETTFYCAAMHNRTEHRSVEQYVIGRPDRARRHIS